MHPMSHDTDRSAEKADLFSFRTFSEKFRSTLKCFQRSLLMSEEPIFHYHLHQQLWEMLSFHAGMDKETALSKCEEYGRISQEEHEYYLNSKNMCMACEYAKNYSEFMSDNGNYCKYCPLLNESKIPNTETCLGGKKKSWNILSNQYNILVRANEMLKEGKDPAFLVMPTLQGKNITVEEFVDGVRRGNQKIISAYGESVSIIGVRCMIAASTISTLKPRPKIKRD